MVFNFCLYLPSLLMVPIHISTETHLSSTHCALPVRCGDGCSGRPLDSPLPHAIALQLSILLTYLSLARSRQICILFSSFSFSLSVLCGAVLGSVLINTTLTAKAIALGESNEPESQHTQTHPHTPMNILYTQVIHLWLFRFTTTLYKQGVPEVDFGGVNENKESLRFRNH